MKKFRYQFTIPMLLCVILLLALAAGGFAWNLINALAPIERSGIQIASYVLICGVSLLLFAFGIGILLFSRYEVGKGKFVTSFGFFRSSVGADEIIMINHFKKSDKLVVYFHNQKYICVVIDPKLYDDFCTAVKLENPSVTIGERHDDDEQKPA